MADSDVTPELRAEVQRRCGAASIKIDDFALGDTMVPRVHLPAGRETRELYLWKNEDAIALLDLPLEEIRYLRGYGAYARYGAGHIEANLQLPAEPSLVGLARKLTGEVFADDAAVKDRLNVQVEGATHAGSKFKLSVRRPTPWMELLCRPTSALTLTIEGPPFDNHDQGVERLETLGHSFLFDLDLRADLAIVLGRYENFIELMERFFARMAFGQEGVKLSFPRLAPGGEALALYSYARTATSLPLVQFLAYYQSIEYYFPIYSQEEAQRRIRNTLKDPVFDPERDSDIVRLLEAARVSGRGGFGDERSQLKDTIRACVDPARLRNMLEADKLKEYYGSPLALKLSKHRPAPNSDGDMRDAVADRVYDIRCKLVHAKASDDKGGDLLLPYSEEARLVPRELDLMQFLARSILIAGSRYISL